ncbi:MAG: hypothetical protein WDA07_12970 [Leucobacter sp.]
MTIDNLAEREASRRRQEKHRRRARLGIALLKAAEGRGLSGEEAIALLQRADYATIQECVAGPGEAHWRRWERAEATDD